uniref:Uncharacterized protein n=1 Tax=Romanomermis culicivorax TaxID=13658 RepID=A0A915HVZ3_ROMCU
MIEEQKLRVKILPDKFSTDLVSDEKFYEKLPDFRVPDLTNLEKKSSLKAAKKSVRAISRVTYKTLLRNITLERSEPTQYAKTYKFMPFILNENFDRSTLKYERSEMLNVLKRLMNIKDEDAAKDAEVDTKTSTTESTDKSKKLESAQEEQGAKCGNTASKKSSFNDSYPQQIIESNDKNNRSHDKNDDASSVDSGLDVATTPVLYIEKPIAKESSMTTSTASSSCTTETNHSPKSCDESNSSALIARTGLELIDKFVTAQKLPPKESGMVLGEADFHHKGAV